MYTNQATGIEIFNAMQSLFSSYNRDRITRRNLASSKTILQFKFETQDLLIGSVE